MRPGWRLVLRIRLTIIAEPARGGHALLKGRETAIFPAATRPLPGARIAVTDIGMAATVFGYHRLGLCQVFLKFSWIGDNVFTNYISWHVLPLCSLICPSRARARSLAPTRLRH
jgi:hypothetical protein